MKSKTNDKNDSDSLAMILVVDIQSISCDHPSERLLFDFCSAF